MALCIYTDHMGYSVRFPNASNMERETGKQLPKPMRQRNNNMLMDYAPLSARSRSLSTSYWNSK